MLDFTAIRAVITDMDGVLWRGNTPLPGLRQFFDFLQSHRLPAVLATNNSSRHPAQYIEKLANMGVTGIQQNQIVTSATATADYLQTHYPAGTRLYVVGMDGLRQMLTEAGFVLAQSDVRAVVAGIDFDFRYDTARHATLLIRAGADFIGTNPDLTFPTPEGLVPGAGSVLAMIEAATDVTPVIIGKPQPAMFQSALRQMNAQPSQTLMIGDRLSTDIDGAARAGLPTALVLTGVNSRDDAAQSATPPDLICDDLPALIAQWSAALS